MSSFLTSAQKSAIDAVFDNLHDTFAREIIIYKDGQAVSINTSSSYNPYYKRSFDGNETYSTTTVSGSYYARILYGKPDATLLTNDNMDAQLKLEILNSTVRIKVNQSGRDFLVDAKRVEFDGNVFTIRGDPRPIGMFDPKYYTFFLTPIDEF